MADNYQMVDNKMKLKTHSKKFSEIPDNYRNTITLIKDDNPNENL